MVYASVPSYLDPPNWNQHQHQQQQHQHQQQQYPEQQHQGHQAGGSRSGVASGGVDTHCLAPAAAPSGAAPGTVRPGSMADRARLAKIPQPEPALKCPRCDSTNTKFCYFNNYSLSQPRHFCKTCRRYWTRGGALRNVPVGGGCRRNKRSKSSSSSSSSKSAASNSHVTGNSAGSLQHTGAIGCSALTPPPQLPFLTSLQHLADYGAAAGNIGLNYGGIQATVDPVDYHSSGGGAIGLEQWTRLQQVQQQQQLPFFTGLEPTQAQPQPPAVLGLYSFDGEGGDGVVGFNAAAGQVHGKATTATAAGLISQLASVKMEENHHPHHGHGLSLARQYLGIPAGNEPFWIGGGGGDTSAAAAGGSSTGGSAWTDLSGFNSSSTGNFL